MEKLVNSVVVPNPEGHSIAALGLNRKVRVKLSKSFKENKSTTNLKRRSLPIALDVAESPEPKRRKNQVENLKSSLSPKYIGIIETDGKRSRYGRTQKFKEDDDFLPTQIACYVRRTPPKFKFVSPGNTYEQKVIPYESPIEKLIQKNKMLATFNNITSKLDVETSPKTVNNIADQSDLETSPKINMTEKLNDETTPKSFNNNITSKLDVKTSSKTCNNNINDKLDIDNVSKTLNITGKLDVESTSKPLNISGKLDVETASNVSKNIIGKLNANTSPKTSKNNITGKLNVKKALLKTSSNRKLDIESTPKSFNNIIDKLGAVSTPKIFNITGQLDIESTPKTFNSITSKLDVETTPKTVNRIGGKLNVDASPKTLNFESTEKSTILDDLEEIVVVDRNQMPSVDVSSKTSSNYSSNYDEETLYSNTVDINSFVSFYKSPSSQSTDSAKGSSIDLEIDFPIKSGDIFWARISPFPYWPCIVWPDPTGRTIVLNKNKIQRQNVKIHVRFFGDNGRRSWINKSNILPYNGREEFEKRGHEYSIKYGKRHNINRAFDVSAKKKFTWENAVAEADEVIVHAVEERSDMFEMVLIRQREMMATERLRRRQSICDNNFLNVPEQSSTGMKRQRSPDIVSEGYENISDMQTKKIKTDLNTSFTSDETELYGIDVKSALASVTEDSVIFKHSEFQKFYDLIKKYIFRKENKFLEKYFDLNLRQIWCLRNLAKSDEDDLNTTMNIRRLSLRIKDISNSSAASLDLKRIAKSDDKVERQKAEKKKSKSIEEVVEDITDLHKNYLFKGLSKESVCKLCRCPTNLVKCGNCQSLIHKDCNNLIASTHITGDLEEEKISSDNSLVKIDHAMCSECSSGEWPNCFVCKKSDAELDEMIKCHINWCTQHYHPKCLKYWPQSKITKSSAKVESLLCPAHVCHTCVSDDPRGKFLQIEKSKLARCVECPATYHSDSFCIPAGTKFLTATQIICPRHGKHEKLNINANWCFICASGGSLICCETCPTAFHLECLKIVQSDDKYICEECETGRLPLYGEMVWAKLGVYRWWPSIIIPPPEVPKNLQARKHDWSEFCIRFFGSNDHTWINRRRVFLYQEGDWGKVNNMKGINQAYKHGLEEARKVSNLLKEKRLLKMNVRKDNGLNGLAPSPYIKIKTNRPVAPVKLQEIDISDLTPCDCALKDEDPCGPYSGCLNRLLMTECNPKICPAAAKCQNQQFEKRSYPPLKVDWTSGKGWGLICEQELKIGTFIIEYVGEVIDDAEFKRRITQKQEEKDENYYFLTLEKDFMIDAGPKGNHARFMNHSCDPNCETQKWTVNGITRIGLFAIKDIHAKTELTFNYNLECLGDNKKICHCGAEKCAGFIGSKYKDPEKPTIPVAVTIKKKSKLKLTRSKSQNSTVSKYVIM